MSMHHAYMRSALQQAVLAMELGEIPIGALLVSPNNIIISGHNHSITMNDPTSHAEIVVIREMAKTIANYRLTGCVLYVTVQPCLMCLGAIEHARIATVYYGASSPKCPVFYHELSKTSLHGPILQTESQELLKSFFKKRR